MYVDDNAHYMDESYRTEYRRFARLEDAIAACMALTAGSVEDTTDASRVCTYGLFGEDPWIYPHPDPEELAEVLTRHSEWPAEEFKNGIFSAWTYARILTAKSRA